MANEPHDVTIPTREDLEQLPRWARVAFAARCARRVQPIFILAWRQGSENRARAVEKAITVTENAAKNGFVTSSIASVAADDAADSADDVYSTASEQYSNAGRAAARAAAYAADAADSAGRLELHIRDTDAGFAARAASSAAEASKGESVRAMHQDYETLAALKKARRWKDTTKVDPDLLGPLWPEGTEPEWAKASKQESQHAEIIQEQEIKRLPHFARVAFAARCARRVQPLFTALWKDAPRKNVEAVDEMVTVAEVMAREGVVSTTPVNHLAFAHADTVVAVHGAANAATHAAYAAQSVAQSASYAALAAADAADADTSTIAAMRDDYERLLAISEEKRWTDTSPVDVVLLGPLWSLGTEPDWAKSLSSESTSTRDPGKLILKFNIPALQNTPMNRAALVAQLKESILAANALHIAHGGSGLRIDDVKAWATVGATMPAQGGGQ